LFRNIIELLQQNEFVALISVDFTKAFDCVKHLTLMQKLQLQLRDILYRVFNWLVSNFDNRGHATRLGDAISRVAVIKASIIHGSVVGPPSPEKPNECNGQTSQRHLLDDWIKKYHYDCIKTFTKPW